MGEMATEANGWSDRFLAAALEPHLWQGVLADMAEATYSSRGQLIGFGPGASAFNWVTGMDEGQIAHSAAIDANTPDQNFRVAADRLPGAPDIVHETHYDIVRQARRSSDYLDMCADLDIMHGCQTKLVVSNGTMVGLALLRSERDGRTSQIQRRQFAEMARHARTAVRMQQAMEHQGFALLTKTFEAMDRACWLIDAAGRVGSMTPRAEALLGATRLRVVDDRLASSRSDETRRINLAVQAALLPQGDPPIPVPMIEDGGGIALLLEIFPLPRRPWEMAFAPRAIAIARVAAPTDRHVQTLIHTFKLTPAEADIAVRIAGGTTRPEIAIARGVSAETLKVQIRSIYDKTACNRESQLVRMVSLLGS
jgi:DNA-binding CsgD family transcriptional regulator